MANITIEIEGPEGESSTTAYLSALGSDTRVGPVSSTEASNRDGLYSATFNSENLSTQIYRMALYASDGTLLSTAYANVDSLVSQTITAQEAFNIASVGGSSTADVSATSTQDDDGSTFTVKAYENRLSTFSISLLDSSGDAIDVNVSDRVQFKIGSDDNESSLEFDSTTSSVNGSGCTRANPTVVTLTAADLDFAAGVYDCEVSLFDNSESGTKHWFTGVLILHGTQN